MHSADKEIPHFDLSNWIPASLMKKGLGRPILTLRESPDGRNFEVRAHAGSAGHLEVGSDSASVRIGQRIRREGQEEIWDSLVVECKERADGTLSVEIVVCHPDWDEPVRIASVESNPKAGPSEASVLTVNFKSKGASL
jgi:hypothetical protein